MKSADGLEEWVVSESSSRIKAAQKGQPTRPQARQEPESYPPGYVEDSCEPRTKLGAFFSSRQGSTVTSTNAGTESAPFLSVTLSLKR
jgi:hypothetical protein